VEGGGPQGDNREGGHHDTGHGDGRRRLGRHKTVTPDDRIATVERPRGTGAPGSDRAPPDIDGGTGRGQGTGMLTMVDAA
jgi:hypothetical protein